MGEPEKRETADGLYKEIDSLSVLEIEGLLEMQVKAIDALDASSPNFRHNLSLNHNYAVELLHGLRRKDGTARMPDDRIVKVRGACWEKAANYDREVLTPAYDAARKRAGIAITVSRCSESYLDQAA